MKWLNPWNWPTLAMQIVSVIVLLAALHFFILPWYYAKDLKEAQKTAQDKANVAKLERESQNKDLLLRAKNEQIKTLEKINADGKRIADANERLQHDLRASEAAGTDLATCLQRADTLDTVQHAVSDFAERVVQEADKQVADKIACTQAWPK